MEENVYNCFINVTMIAILVKIKQNKRNKFHRKPKNIKKNMGEGLNLEAFTSIMIVDGWVTVQKDG